MSTRFPRLGPEVFGNGRTRFRVWAPAAEKSVELVWAPPGEAAERVTAMTRGANDVWNVTVDGAPEGTGYAFRIDEDPARTWPDPLGYEELRPGDVDGPSRVVDLAAVTRAPGRPPGPIVTAEGLAAGGVLEVHVATEVPGGDGPDGTFDTLADGRLDDAVALGLAGIELMPVAIAPGAFDWGYNGINPGSVRRDWGGWAGLVRLIDAAHRRGLAVGLDVVGNHVGSDGGYVEAYGPFAAGRGPWGDTPDFERPAVRAWWLQSVERLAVAGADFLRLDAVQGMYFGREPKRPHVLIETARHLRKLAEAGRIPRPPLLVAEAGSDWVADNRHWLLAPVDDGGAGVAGFWDDELRHALFLWAYQVPLDPAELVPLGLAGYLPRVAAMISQGTRTSSGPPDPIAAADVARMVAEPSVGADVLPGHGHWRAWRNHDQTGNHLLGLDSGLQGLLLDLHRLGLTPAQAQAVVEAVVDGAAVVPEVNLGAGLAEAVGAAVGRAEAMDRAMSAFIWSQPGTPYDFDRARFPFGHGSAKPAIVEGTVKGRAAEFGFAEPPTADELTDNAAAGADPDDLTMPLPQDPATHAMACRGPRDGRPERALLLADLVAGRRGLDLDAAPAAAAVGGGDGVLTVLGQGETTRVVVVNRGTAGIEVDLAEHVPAGTGPWRVVLDTGAAVYGGDGQNPARVAGNRLVLPPATLVQLAPALPV